MSDFEMEQELARQLLVTGGVLIFLGVPEGTEFGIDMKSWNTAGEFRGIKMIPPGIHFIHYAAVSNTGDVAPRRGFMYDFKEKEFVVKMWDKVNENLISEEVSEESIQRLKDNLCNIDKFLAPYPFDIYNKWKCLSSNITDELVSMLTPENGIISSALELISCDNNDRPRGKVRSLTEQVQNDQESQSNTPGTSEETTTDIKEIKPNGSVENIPEPSQPTKRRSRPSTLEEREEELLPHLKPSPGMALKFTTFPDRNFPENCSPAEITKHSLDQSYVLNIMISRYKHANYIVGELEFAYVCFLIGHSLDAFEQWKKLVTLLCSCEDAITKHRSMYLHFINSLETQILEIPEEFLADIVMNNNIVYIKLRDFFRTVNNSEIENRLKVAVERFKQCLTDKLLWDFSDIDQEEDDERPVIVHLP